MDFELQAAKQKYEREQREKKERARVRLERERKANEEAARVREALETSQRLRRLQAAQDILAAQQQEAEDCQLGDGIRFNKVLKAVPLPGHGDKIKLPASAFDELASQNALDKGPMYFEVSALPLKDASDGQAGPTHATHAGVLEFTASEGFVELPEHVLLNCGLSSAISNGISQARIRYVRLPKGVYVKLQAGDLDFCNLTNQRAVLETTLRKHATLSVGDVLVVSHGGQNHRLHVLELKPTSGVSVIETDIEVDVIGPPADGLKFTSWLPLTVGVPERRIVKEGEYVYFRFIIGEPLARKAGAGEVHISINLTVEDSATDADLYVSTQSIPFPTQQQHHFASHRKGSKVVSLTDSGQIEAGTYNVGVYGFKGLTKFAISIDVSTHLERKSQGQKLGTGRVPDQTDQVPADDVVCENCKQLVPSKTLPLHEAYCSRHNTLCPHPGCGVVLRKEEIKNHVHCEKCGEAFQLDELGKHMLISHSLLECDCGAELPMEEMVIHRATFCPQRKITCRFCGDEFQAGPVSDNLRDRLHGLTQHESTCGARTDVCDICGRSVMLKEMDLHRAAAHTKALIPEQDSVASKTGGSLDVKDFTGTGGSSRLAVDEEVAICPICNREFRGSDSELEVVFHIDHHHSSSDDVHRIGPMPAAGGGIYHKTLRIECPICGMAVHSERDLSSHIDLLH